MTDIFSKKKRSWLMSRIRGKETKIEQLLEHNLKIIGVKYKKHPKIYGNPDILLGENTVIFVDGCFWHKCPKHFSKPKSRTKFWTQKIMKNATRDKIVSKKLRKYGYNVLRFWEHDVEKRPEYVVKKILSAL